LIGPFTILITGGWFAELGPFKITRLKFKRGMIHKLLTGIGLIIMNGLRLHGVRATALVKLARLAAKFPRFTALIYAHAPAGRSRRFVLRGGGRGRSAGGQGQQSKKGDNNGRAHKLRLKPKTS